MAKKAAKPAHDSHKAVREAASSVINNLKAGYGKQAVAEKLSAQGVSRETAARFVDSVHMAAVDIGKKEKLTGKAVALALAGAIIASMIGGLIWGWITILTKYEFGIAAVGMGVIAGLAIVKFSGGKKGLPLQAAAIAASVIGIAIGKYVIFIHFAGKALSEELGTPISLSYLSFSNISLFLGNIGIMLSFFDILWVVLAVAAAWQIPKAVGIKQ
ncbi:TPA: hypothetical protein HA231_05820 [Candidatus Woesearchaeota archaeon]|nr:hypothetical protein [Candidatus Woesearchaeota archaeon]